MPPPPRFFREINCLLIIIITSSCLPLDIVSYGRPSLRRAQVDSADRFVYRVSGEMPVPSD